MRTIFSLIFLLSSLAANAAQNEKLEKNISSEPFKTVHVADVAKCIEKSGRIRIYDVNSEETRVKEGMIPGATPIAMSYDPSLLPTDKGTKLVFYCAGEKCMASHEAAKLAVKAGFKDVNVMSDGIAGWKAAGKPTDKKQI